MKKIIQKIKNYKLRTVCVFLSIVLFGVIVFSLFNNVEDTYSVAYTCSNGWYLASSTDGYCCPDSWGYMSSSKKCMKNLKRDACVRTYGSLGAIFDNYTNDCIIAASKASVMKTYKSVCWSCASSGSYAWQSENERPQSFCASGWGKTALSQSSCAPSACYLCGGSQGASYQWGRYGGSSYCKKQRYTEAECLAQNPKQPESQKPSDFVFDYGSGSGTTDEVADTIQYYKVIFDMDGGKTLDDRTEKYNYVRGDKAVGAPATNPIKSGYAFVQWEYNGSKFDFNTKLDDIKSSLKSITENNIMIYQITLKATYVALDYSNLECPDGKILDPSVRKCYSVQPASSDYPQFTRYAYTSGSRWCWALNNSQGKPGGIFFKSEVKCLDVGEGSGTMCYSQGKNNRIDGEYANYSHADTWLQFDSCLIASACTTSTISESCEQRWATIRYNISDATEKKVEETKTYTITYNSNGGNYSPDNQLANVGSSLEISSTGSFKEGYIFVGWNTKADGSGTSYATGATYTENTDITLYAQYEKITYTITYDANGGSGAPSSQVKEYDTDLTLSTTKPTKGRYTFASWNTKADGSGTSYAAGATYTEDDDVTLYAQYSNGSYTITYECNGGTLTNKTKNVTYNKQYGTLGTPTKKGYTFKGWYKESTFVTVVNETTVVSDAKDHTLYAKWEINSYILTVNNGVSTSKYTLKYNEEKDIPVPSRSGYKFVRWNISGTDSTINNNKFKMGISASTLTAVWEVVVPKINNYTVNGKYIKDINFSTDISKLNLRIDSVYVVKVYDKNSKLKTTGLVCTGDKINIYLDNTSIASYTSIIKGDVNGDGTITVGDVSKLYQYLKKKVTMEDYFVIAGNVVDTDDSIKTGDVAKLYQFTRKKINSLD